MRRTDCSLVDQVILLSQDLKQFEVDTNVIRRSNTVLTKLKRTECLNLGIPVVFLSNVFSQALIKILEYCQYHKDDPIIKNHVNSNYLDNVILDPWDIRFCIQLDRKALDQVLTASKELEIQCLANVCTIYKTYTSRVKTFSTNSYSRINSLTQMDSYDYGFSNVGYSNSTDCEDYDDIARGLTLVDEGYVDDFLDYNRF